jgi:hypothetical protein
VAGQRGHGQDRAGEEVGERGPAFCGYVQGQQPERQPGHRLQHGQLQRRIGGQVAAEGEGHGGDQRAHPAAGVRGGRPVAAAQQPQGKEVGEHGGQEDVEEGLILQRLHRKVAGAGGQQRHGEADGIENRRLGIG